LINYLTLKKEKIYFYFSFDKLNVENKYREENLSEQYQSSEKVVFVKKNNMIKT
jgi:hypothetical protein